MNLHRPDVVFDCNIFLQALTRGTGPAAEALRRVERNEVTLYVSRRTLRELRAVLAYPEIREKNPHVTDSMVDEFVERIAYRGVLVRDVPHVVQFPRDPHDEPYLDLVAAVRADFLVTRDRDLLDLATDHATEAKEFRQRFPSLKIVGPVGFLYELDSKEKKS
jgi:putative PIN family toxin of toxin-antitoxin system